LEYRQFALIDLIANRSSLRWSRRSTVTPSSTG